MFFITKYKNIVSRLSHLAKDLKVGTFGPDICFWDLHPVPSSLPVTLFAYVRSSQAILYSPSLLKSTMLRFILIAFLKNYIHFVIKTCKFRLCKIYQIFLFSSPTAIVGTCLYRFCFSSLIFASLTKLSLLVLVPILILPPVAISLLCTYGMFKCFN